MIELRDAMQDDIAALKGQKKAGRDAKRQAKVDKGFKKKQARQSERALNKTNREIARAQKKREKEEEEAATQRYGGYIRRRGKVRRRRK